MRVARGFLCKFSVLPKAKRGGMLWFRVLVCSESFNGPVLQAQRPREPRHFQKPPEPSPVPQPSNSNSLKT